MKNLIFLLIVLQISFIGKTQITLEHTYDSASVSFSANSSSFLYMINLEVDSFKYVFIDLENKKINFYNLDHSFWKTISLASATDLNPNSDYQRIFFISQHLFDLDNEIELLYSDDASTSNYVTEIINEDGSIIFSVSNQFPFISQTRSWNNQIIYNTSVGAKMILNGTPNDGNAYVYGLPGKLTSSRKFDPLNYALDISLIYPNPSKSYTNIEYNLPKGIDQGELLIFDLNGNEIKKYDIGNNFNVLKVSTADIAAGTYIVIIQASNYRSSGKKLIINK